MEMQKREAHKEEIMIIIMMFMEFNQLYLKTKETLYSLELCLLKIKLDLYLIHKLSLQHKMEKINRMILRVVPNKEK